MSSAPLKKAGLRIKPPKTKRGRRNATLPADTIAMLRAHKVNLEPRLGLGMGNITPKPGFSAQPTAAWCRRMIQAVIGGGSAVRRNCP
jgi:hypothetical protein